MATRLIKEKTIILNVAGRTFRYKEIIEEIIVNSNCEVVDLTRCTNNESTNEVFRPTTPAYANQSSFDETAHSFTTTPSPTSPYYAASPNYEAAISSHSSPGEC